MVGEVKIRETGLVCLEAQKRENEERNERRRD
jgi:hypothetical protein